MKQENKTTQLSMGKKHKAMLITSVRHDLPTNDKQRTTNPHVAGRNDPQKSPPRLTIPVFGVDARINTGGIFQEKKLFVVTATKRELFHRLPWQETFSEKGTGSRGRGVRGDTLSCRDRQ